MRARRWRTHSRRKSSYLFALFVFVKEGNGRWSINGVKTRVYDTRRIKQRTSEWRILDETAKRKYCLFNLTHVLFCLDSFSFNFVLFLFVCLHQVALLRGRRYSAFLEPIQLIIFFVISGCWKKFLTLVQLKLFQLLLLRAPNNLLARAITQQQQESVGFQLIKVTVRKLSIFDQRHYFSLH